MERQDSNTSVNMSANNIKLNVNAPAFTPSKRDLRAQQTAVALQTTLSDARINDNSSKRAKQKPLKTNRPRELKLLKPPKSLFEAELQIGKIKPNNRRGQISINHLLEFSLPDDHDDLSRTSNRRQQTRRRRSSNHQYGHKIHLTGERYINVNYKFVVDFRGDYRPQVLDTNLPVDRANILRVVIPKNDTQCPICLTDELVAPRMISCGHSFCLTCLLRYLDSEDPVPPKGQAPSAIKSAKLKECPFCSKKIKPEECLPALINPIDERFETPKIGQDVVLQLMYRPHNKIMAIPYQLKLRNSDIYSGNIPWFTSNDSQKYDPEQLSITSNDLFKYSRLMKAGAEFSIDNYLREIQEIKELYDQDKILFNDDGVYYKKAIKDIESLIEACEVKFLNDKLTNLSLNSHEQANLDVSIEELTQRQVSQSEFNDENTFFFYQTSFDSKTKFFVSSLDTRILKELYGSYSNFPLCLKILVENIAYDFVVNDELTKRFKFLSYIPQGTEVAFLELNWFEDPIAPFSKGKKSHPSQKRKSILPPEVYQRFQKELTSRSDKTRMKNFKEEKSRLRYQNELEYKTREFYANENNFKLEDYGVTAYNKFDHLSISDGDEDNMLPLLSNPVHEDIENNASNFTTTVWGTKIAKTELDHEQEEEDNDYFNELLRQSREKEELKKQGKKGRKKLVLLNTSRN